MSDWIEFKYDDGIRDEVVRFCTDVYRINSFHEASEDSTFLTVDAGETEKTLLIAEPYDEVKRKIFEAMEPKYQVQIVEPKEDK